MGLGGLLKRLFGGSGDDGNPYAANRDVDAGSAGGEGTRTVEALAERLGLSVQQLEEIPTDYYHFTIPKRKGGQRKLAAPCDALKVAQRGILKRLLNRLPVHSAAMGFEAGRSIVTNAYPHAGRPVVVRMDVIDFFPSTTQRRVRDYFRKIGWDKRAAKLLTSLCTLDGGLPQGAPTSPRLSNLVNYALDARLAGVAGHFGAVYTRYADDMTFSLTTSDRGPLIGIISSTKAILRDYGYRLHQDKKLRISRGHHRQLVTGLVVNERVNLPRSVRRKLRAVRHHLATGQPATMTPEQLAGWTAFEQMVERQSLPGDEE